MGHPPPAPPTPPAPPSPPLPPGTKYVRLPQEDSCRKGTILTSKAACAAAFVALKSTLQPGANDNTRCCNGDDLPYGCTYRLDNDFVFNDNEASPKTYALGGWRAVCRLPAVELI